MCRHTLLTSKSEDKCARDSGVWQPPTHPQKASKREGVDKEADTVQFKSRRWRCVSKISCFNYVKYRWENAWLALFHYNDHYTHCFTSKFVNWCVQSTVVKIKMMCSAFH